MITLSSRCKDISGTVFGSITVLRPMRINAAGVVVWACQCSCGTSLEKTGTALRSGIKKYTDPRLPSCGCMQKVLMSAAAKKRFTTHGFANSTKTHPLYKLYHKVQSRCHNSNDTNYHLYGAKGVTLCPEWRGDPQAFIDWCLANGWQPGLQLDKDILCEHFNIHPKVYSPATCQFVTQHDNLLQSASRSTYGTNKNIKFSHEDIIGMNKMYQEGATKRAVGKHYGISNTHASRMIATDNSKPHWRTKSVN